MGKEECRQLCGDFLLQVQRNGVLAEREYSEGFSLFWFFKMGEITARLVHGYKNNPV